MPAKFAVKKFKTPTAAAEAPANDNEDGDGIANKLPMQQQAPAPLATTTKLAADSDFIVGGDDDDDDDRSQPLPERQQQQPQQHVPATSARMHDNDDLASFFEDSSSTAQQQQQQEAADPNKEKSLTELYLEHQLKLEREKMFGPGYHEQQQLQQQQHSSSAQTMADSALQRGVQLGGAEQQQLHLQQQQQPILSAPPVPHQHPHQQSQPQPAAPAQRMPQVADLVAAVASGATFSARPPSDNSSAAGGAQMMMCFEDVVDSFIRETGAVVEGWQSSSASGQQQKHLVEVSRRPDDVDSGNNWKPSRRSSLLPAKAADMWRDVQGVRVNPAPADGITNPCLDVEDLRLFEPCAEDALRIEIGGSRLLPLLQHALPEGLRGTSMAVTAPSGCGKALLTFVLIAEAVSRSLRSTSRAAPQNDDDHGEASRSSSSNNNNSNNNTRRHHQLPIALMLVPTREAESDETLSLRRIARHSTNSHGHGMLEWFTVNQGLPFASSSGGAGDNDGDDRNATVHVFNATNLLYASARTKSQQQKHQDSNNNNNNSAADRADDAHFEARMRPLFSRVTCIVGMHAERFSIPPFSSQQGQMLFRVPGHIYPAHMVAAREQALQYLPPEERQQQPKMTSDAQWVLVGNEPVRLRNCARACEEALRRPFVGFSLQNKAQWRSIVHATEFATAATEKKLLIKVLQRTPAPAVVFTASRRLCDELINELRSLGFRATGDPSQMLPADGYRGSNNSNRSGQRTTKLEASRSSPLQGMPHLKHNVLVVADAAIKGFHSQLPAFSHVVNVELPPGAVGEMFDDVMQLRAECLGLGTVKEHRMGRLGLMTTIINNERTSLTAATEFARFLKSAELPVPPLLVPLRKRARLWMKMSKTNGAQDDDDADDVVVAGHSNNAFSNI